jgi:hypothetical protein
MTRRLEKHKVCVQLSCYSNTELKLVLRQQFVCQHGVLQILLKYKLLEEQFFYLAIHNIGTWENHVTVFVRFFILTAACMKMNPFWDVGPCSLVKIGRLVRGAYCLHHQGDNSLLF